MKIRHEVEVRVRALFAEEGWDNIDLSDRIEQDLRARGQDLWPMFDALYDEYQVNFAMLDFDRYFHGEYYRLRDMLWYLVRKVTGREITDREECTIGHLIDVAMEGYWFDPPPPEFSSAPATA